MNLISIRKSLIASSVAVVLGAPPATEAVLVTNVLGANTWSTDSANATMPGPNGGVIGMSNDLTAR